MTNKNCSMKRIIIFGTGAIWGKYQDYVFQHSSIVCFIDNDSAKWNTPFYGTKVVKPQDIFMYTFDFVLIMSNAETAMSEQLLSLGVPLEKIWTWEKYSKEYLAEKIVRYNFDLSDKVDIILFTQPMGYSGGTITALYAADALQMIGKHVVICAQRMEKSFLQEFSDDYKLAIVPALPHIGDNLKKIIDQCSAVIVNVFPMLPVAVQVCKMKPTLWWIHESLSSYKSTMEKYPELCNSECIDILNIKAVSSVAKKNFNHFFPNTVIDTMPYGLSDEASISERKKSKKIVFAIIGSVIEVKAQDIFLRAIHELNDNEKNMMQAYVIGAFGISQYAKKVQSLANGLNNVFFTGNLSRHELKKMYSKIDVVVCPSRADCLPIVVTEAMMYRKACIISDETGTAEYITNGKNGLICKAGDVTDLAEKMRYFLYNQDELIRLGKNGRQVYEQWFSMNIFAENLQCAIDETLSQNN